MAVPVSAANWVIDFDQDGDGNTLASDAIFADKGALNNTGNDNFQRYTNGIVGAADGLGVRISAGRTAQYWYNSDTTNATYAVGYDSSGAIGRDPDLEENGTDDGRPANSGFKTSNLGGNSPDSTGYRNILIIQEKYSGSHYIGDCGGTSGGVCAKADDEAAGGVMKFDFTEAVDLVGMNIFDIEEQSSGYMGKVWFDYADGGTFEASLDIPKIGGSTVAFLDFGSLGENVIAMYVKCFGSCGIDNITGATDVTPPGGGVPEPGAMALFGVGIAGMALVRRRRKLAA